MFVQGRGAGAKPHTVPRRRATLVGAYVSYRCLQEGGGTRGQRFDKEVDHKVHPTQGAAQVTATGAAACCPARRHIPGYDLSVLKPYTPWLT